MTPKKALKVVLDTNFLMIPIRFGVDIFSEMSNLEISVEPMVTRAVLNEIKLLLREAKPSFSRELEFALIMATRCTLIEDECRPDEKVDDSLIRVAMDNKYMVGTTDAELRRRLRKIGIPVLYLRQSKKLFVEGISV